MYGIQLDDILFDNTSYNLCSSKKYGCMIAIDSGSTYMSVPKYAGKILSLHHIPLENQPCGNSKNITLVMGGIKYTLDSEDWQIRNSKTHSCQSALKVQEVGYEMFLVGDRFMRKYYTIFDRDSNRLGLSKSSNKSL